MLKLNCSLHKSLFLVLLVCLAVLFIFYAFFYGYYYDGSLLLVRNGKISSSCPSSSPFLRMDEKVINGNPNDVSNRNGVQKLKDLLNKTLRIEMSDGRVLIGIFLCTDADANVILGSCSEYLPQEFQSNKAKEEPRMLGMVMVPGKHIISVSKDLNDPSSVYSNGPSVEVI